MLSTITFSNITFSTILSTITFSIAFYEERLPSVETQMSLFPSYLVGPAHIHFNLLRYGVYYLEVTLNNIQSISLFSLIGAVDDDDCGNMLNGVTSTSCILPAQDLHLRRKLKRNFSHIRFRMERKSIQGFWDLIKRSKEEWSNCPSVRSAPHRLLIFSQS